MNNEILEQIFNELRIRSKHSLIDSLNEFNKGEIGVLSYLMFDCDGVSAGCLSNQLNVSTARIASILNSLEDKKYIKRISDNNDKRKTIVYITNNGKELVNQCKKEILNKINNVLNDIGIEDIKRYINISNKIRNSLNNLSNQKKEEEK